MPSISRLFGRRNDRPPVREDVAHRDATRTQAPTERDAIAPSAQSAHSTTLAPPPSAHIAGVRPPRTSAVDNAHALSAPPVIDRTEDLRARLVDRGDLHFRSLREALVADAKLGDTHSAILEAAIRYVKSHAEHDNIGQLLSEARVLGARNVVHLLENGGWQSTTLLGADHAGDFGELWNLSMRGVITTPQGFVAISDQAHLPIIHFAAGDNWRPARMRLLPSGDAHKLRDPGAVACVGEHVVVADRAGAVLVMTPADGHWTVRDIAAARSQPGAAWNSICAITDDVFVTASRDKAMTVWRLGGASVVAEDIKSRTGSTFVTPAPMGFAAYTHGDTRPTMYRQVNGKWKAESAGGHRDCMTALCGLSNGTLVTSAEDQTLRVWERGPKGWKSKGLPRLEFYPTGIMALGDGFVVHGERKASHYRMQDGAWKATPIEMREGLGKGALTGMCATEQGFVAVANYQATARMRRFDSQIPWTLAQVNPRDTDFATALKNNRLSLATRLLQQGAKPSDMQFYLATTSPNSGLAQLAYERGVQLRNGAGETLVGAALKRSLASAAIHISRGAHVDTADIETFMQRAGEPGMMPVFVALVARGLVGMQQLPHNLERQSEDGQTLVSALCLFGMHDEALSLLRENPALPVLPIARGATYGGDLQRAAAQAMAALPLAFTLPALQALPEHLRAALVTQAIASHHLALADVCMAAYVQRTLKANDAVRTAIADLLRDPSTPDALLKALFAHGGIAFWSGPTWEAITYTEHMLQALRDAGAPAVIVARCASLRPPLTWVAPKWPAGPKLKAAGKLAWLSPFIPRRVDVTRPGGGAVPFTADRHNVTMPAALQDAEAWGRRWRVTFAGEPGIDATGLTKDWLALRAANVFNADSDIFRPSDIDASLLLFRPELAGDTLDASVREALAHAGRLYARAFRERVASGVNLPQAWLAQLVGQDLTLDHLKEAEPTYGAAMQALLDTVDVDALLPGQTFTFSDGLGNEIPLRPGGGNEGLTLDNRHAYVAAVVDFVLRRRHAAAQEAFFQGVYDVIPHALLRHLSGPDLSAITQGETSVDMDDWQKYWRFDPAFTDGPDHDEHGAMRDHTLHPRDLDAYIARASRHSDAARRDAEAEIKISKLFWEAAQDLDGSERMRLIEAVTGLKRIPVGGMRLLPKAFTVKVKPDNDGKVNGHTCYNRIDLPRVTSREQMKIVLLAALASDKLEGNNDV